MGDFRLEVDMVGGHGCQREVKDGGEVRGCGQDGCPDCICARFVADMRRFGAVVNAAKLIHWPGQPTQVVDEFIVAHNPHGTGPKAVRVRRGSF